MRSLPLGVARLTRALPRRRPADAAARCARLERHLEHELGDAPRARPPRRRRARDRHVGDGQHARRHGAGGARRGRRRGCTAPAPRRTRSRALRRRVLGARRRASAPSCRAWTPSASTSCPRRSCWSTSSCRRAGGRELVGLHVGAARGRPARPGAAVRRSGAAAPARGGAAASVEALAARFAGDERPRPAGGAPRARALRRARRADARAAAARRASCSSTRRCCTTSATPSTTTAITATPYYLIRNARAARLRAGRDRDRSRWWRAATASRRRSSADPELQRAAAARAGGTVRGAGGAPARRRRARPHPLRCRQGARRRC